jgi:hypothetical protein
MFAVEKKRNLGYCEPQIIATKRHKMAHGQTEIRKDRGFLKA